MMNSGPLIKLGLTSGAVGFGAMFLALSVIDSTATATGAGEPETIQLTGTVRDFRERNSRQGGHPDFERQPDLGYGHYIGNVSTELGGDGKPVFTGAGHKVAQQWEDADGHPICYCMPPAAGDTAGSAPAASTGGIQSEETFNQWFRDLPGTNVSAPLSITLVRQADGTYVFDDKDDPYYSELGGFFPIEGDLFGNPGGSPDRNFHFTFELATTFVYNEDENQMFRFLGDDDVWVFINNQMVIDIGGVHSAVTQYVDLNRLDLEDGQQYELRFFFAERHRTQSNFRIETNINLQSMALPAVTAAFD